MESRKEAKLNMFHNIIALCEGNLATIALVAAFETAYNAFKTTVTAIVAAQVQIATPTGGYATSKTNAKKSLADLAAGIAGMVYAYAVVINDDVLKDQMDVRASDITRAKDEEVIDICTYIHEAANDIIADLADYGVTAPVLATFQTAIDDYADKSPKPIVARQDKKAKNVQVNTMYKDAEKILKARMDRLAVNFRSNGHEAFYQSYKATRKFITPGAFSTELKILVLNKANNDPIVGVKVYRDDAPEFKRSTVKGFVTFKDIEQGGHSFVLKHKLFEDLAVNNVMISHGKKLQITALMIPGTANNEPVLTSVTREGDVIMGSIVEIDTSGFKVTDSTTIQIEVSGNELLFSAAPAPGPTMGPTVWHVFPGTQNKTLAAFGVLIGASDTNSFLKVQCIGPLSGHYKITFNNVEAE